MPATMNRRTRGLLAAMSLAAAAQGAGAQILSENFDSFAALAPAGWVFTNLSSSPLQGWFAGNTGVFAAQSGAAGSYAAANFLSSSAVNGTISNWMITPAMTLAGGEVLTFWARAESVDYLDGLTVRLNPTGTTAAGDFTLSLMSVAAVPAQWTEYTLAIPALGGPVSARIAFQYTSPDAFDANYLGIDTVAVVPEPGTALLLGLGAVGLLLRRRMAA
jgi:hypothetical protein